MDLVRVNRDLELHIKVDNKEQLDEITKIVEHWYKSKVKK